MGAGCKSRGLPVRVLVLAPHPFYQERGTPIAVDLVLRALSERGDEVDLLTYHEGVDRVYERVRIHRIEAPVNIKDIPPGPSLKKIVCDMYLMVKFVSLIRKNCYDIVHAVEEGAFMALIVCPLLSTPYIYDMDSSMVTQIIDKYRFLRVLEKPLRFVESLPMRFAAAVIAVCNALAADARRYRAENVLVLEDVSLIQATEMPGQGTGIRDKLQLTRKIAMYVGNLESYQGIDLMLDSFSIVSGAGEDIDLVIIGGSDAHIEKYSGKAASLGIGHRVHFLGKRPVDQIGQYLAQADILLSPRTNGVNTPMKIYSYLHSGTPVLATRLPTHTQVVTDDIAMLAEPNKRAFASAMLELLRDTDLRSALAANARNYVEHKHSYRVFKGKLSGLYARLEQGAVNA